MTVDASSSKPVPDSPVFKPDRREADCLSEATLRRLLDGSLNSEHDQACAERHLEECDACVARLNTLAGPPPRDCHRLLSRDARRRPVSLARLIRLAASHPFDPRPPSATDSATTDGPWAQLPGGFTNPTFLGRGSSGIVYRARQSSLGREVALKVLHADQSPRHVERAQHEAQVLAALNHPHLITIHEAQLLQEPPYLVMEWIAGGSLKDRLKQGPLPIAEAILLALQLAQGVVAFHSLGIIHRDLKPANVLLSATTARDAPDDVPFCAKITDFGLARAVDAATHSSQEGAAVGTPSYMAPEQTLLRPELGPVGQGCDIYGLGAVVFAALTGQPPHVGDTPLAILMTVAWEDAAWLPTLRPDIPVDLATIVAKCLRHDPGQRYLTARELLDDLQRLRDGHPITARSYSIRERLRNGIRRHPTLSASLALGGILLFTSLLGIGYHLVRLQESLQEVIRERAKTSLALAEANRAVQAEQRQRQHAIRQANLTHDMLHLTFEGKKTPSAGDQKLMNTIRGFYKEQLQDPGNLSPDVAEVISEGLLNCCLQEQLFFHRPDRILADTAIALDLLRRLPDSDLVRMYRGQAHLLRFQTFRSLQRETEAQESLGQLVPILKKYDGWKNQRQLDHLKACVATLWNAGQPDTALNLVQRTLQYEPRADLDLHRPTAIWYSLLSLQAVEIGLLHHLQRSDEAEVALHSYRQLSQRFQERFPEKRSSLAVQWLRLLAQHIRHIEGHSRPDQVRHWLAEGSTALADLRTEPHPRSDDALALLEWILLLSTLPADLANPSQFDELAAEAVRRGRKSRPAAIGDPLYNTLVRAQLAMAKRAMANREFAEALRLGRDALADLAAAAGSAENAPWQQTSELAAQACRELGWPAEELTHLSLAASLAEGADRTRLEARLQQVLRSLTATAEPLRNESEESAAER